MSKEALLKKKLDSHLALMLNFFSFSLWKIKIFSFNFLLYTKNIPK